MNISLSSAAFKEGESIPVKYSCQGEDVSPPLEWGAVPEGTRTLALTCEDPDAPGGIWVHWVLYGLRPSARDLGEHVPAKELLPQGGRQGVNDFGKIGYGGPCPPPGKAHHYFFRLYALDTELALKPRSTRADLLRAMQGHILGEGRLMGIYQRR